MKIILFLFLEIVLFGCGINNTMETPGVTVIVKEPVASVYPQPDEQPVVEIKVEPYPGPLGGQVEPQAASIPGYYVTHLVVPTPSSGKAVVTGILLIGGEDKQPYLATLYLGPTIPPSTPDYPPMISFSEKSDPLAVQDVDTGRFLFSDVSPGQYGMILWSPFGGNPLVDENGDTILFSVNADEVKDLGIIPIQ
jgi:hypothetical protein